MTIRASKKTKTEVSLHDPIGVDKEGNELPLTLYQPTIFMPCIYIKYIHAEDDVYWGHKANMPDSRAYFRAAVLFRQAGSYSANIFEKYNPEYNTWGTLRYIPFMGVEAVNIKIY